MEFDNLKEILDELSGVADITPQGEFKVLDPKRMAGRIMDRLVWTAVFSPEATLRDAARWVIRAAALALGAVPSSVQSLYEVVARGETGGFTVPACNLRGVTYDTARSMFRAARETGSALFVFEIARSEIGYTEQRPAEYSACVLAAAVREGWQGPVFLQGDHFQFNAKKTAEAPEAELQSLQSLGKEAIDAGFYNIDIDSSTLVVLERPTVVEQQRENGLRCAELTTFLRQNQPPGITISIGGEIGEVGKKNSTVEEFEAFMQEYRRELDLRMPKVKGISKISVQTGTQHGGMPLPDGSVADAAVDFEVLKDIGAIARSKYGLGGTVQHGASTLPDSLFDQFPRHECIEIHLATQLQNLFFEHPSFPHDLKEEIYGWIRQNLASEFRPDFSDEQNLYRTRKKTFGPFKKKLWSIPDESLNPILSSLERKFVTFMTRLNVVNTRPLVERYVRLLPVRPPIPESLKSALSPVRT